MLEKNFYIKTGTRTELETFIFLLERKERIKEDVKNSMLWNFSYKEENVYFLQMDEKGYYSALQTINYNNKDIITFNQYFNKYNK